MKFAYQIRPWAEEFSRAWQEVADAGYHAVESFSLSQWFPRPSEFRELLDGFGLALAAMECGGEWVVPERAEAERDGAMRQARFLSEVGGEVMVLSGGRRPPEGAPPESFTALADTLTEIGARCRELNLRLCYHPREGTLIEYRDQVSILLDATDPQLVSLCLDTGDMARMGCDPIEVLRTHRERVGHVHLKDLDWHTHQPQVPGAGALNLGEWLADLQSGGYAGWITVELDSSPHPLEDARASKDFLASLGLAV